MEIIDNTLNIIVHSLREEWKIDEISDLVRTLGMNPDYVPSDETAYLIIAYHLIDICPDIDRYISVLTDIIRLDKLESFIDILSDINMPDTCTKSDVLMYLLHTGIVQVTIYAFHGRGLPLDLYDPIRHNIQFDHHKKGVMIQGLDLTGKYEAIYKPKYVFDKNNPSSKLRGGWLVPYNTYPDFYSTCINIPSRR